MDKIGGVIMKQVKAAVNGECEGCFYHDNKIDCMEIDCQDGYIWVQEKKRGKYQIKQFEYMDEYYLEPDQGLVGKMEKIDEEYKEVKKALESGGAETTSDLAQEILDLILVSLNFLKKLESEEMIDIPTELFKHQVKLNGYLETGKYKK